MRAAWSSNVALALAVTAIAASAACTSVSTVRLQPETVAVGDGLRPVAGIQANATSAYFLFVPLPGGADLDNVVNRLLIVTAKTVGADKIAGLEFEATPSTGVWALRKLLGWRSARASGIAVQVVEPPPDPDANQGPEAPPASSPGAAPGAATGQ